MKVVTAEEMKRLEKKAVAQGASEEQFMLQAGRQVAMHAKRFIHERGLSKKILLLVGRGNNGGDAYAAGSFLLDEGFEVVAYRLDGKEEVSPLNQLFAKRFQDKKGKIHEAEKGCFEKDVLVIDGLLGTGCKEAVSGKLAQWIDAVNKSKAPILAIDLPSGLNGTTGEGAKSAIRATQTVALGLPKSGLFLKEGWNCVGTLHVADFGMKAKEIQAVAEMADLKELNAFLPKIARNRHKYQAGLVLGIGGSVSLSGAPKLSSLAALRSGAGVIRLFYPKEIEEEMRTLPFEVIHEAWEEKRWEEGVKKAKAIFVGPGMGREVSTKKWLKKYLPDLEVPCVIDADALYFFDELKKAPEQSILTPHLGELRRLTDCETDFFSSCSAYAKEKKVTLLVKGSPTFVFTPKHLPMIVPYGDPGMATAGSGDVLTGVIAGLLAQGCSLHEAAVLGASLHGLAGEEAARRKTSYCLIASDLIDCLPTAFQQAMR